jgi:threonine/homoserine/homoserine lactone efflux protein
VIDPSLIAFIGIAALLTILPAVDMALVAKVTLQDGKRAAFFTSLSISSGLPVHATASALGLPVILSTSATAFTIVKVAGALYFAYPAVQTFRHASRAAVVASMARARTQRRAFA